MQKVCGRREGGKAGRREGGEAGRRESGKAGSASIRLSDR
jgi:hypothetical protein